MGERPDEVGRDPGRRDPLGADERATRPLPGEPGFDPATDAFEPEAVRDPALGAGAEVDEVEAARLEIERTRADMGETVDAIQGRLSPENLKERAKDRVKEATVGRVREARSGIVDTVRANPLPAALTGIGLGWLLMNARQQSPAPPRYRDDVSRYRTPTNEYAPEVHEYPPRHDEGAEGSSAGEAVGDAVGSARDRVGETADRARDKAGDLAGRAQDRAEDLGGQTREEANRLGNQVRHQAKRAGGGFRRMLNENPLAVGALSVGAGAAIGLAIPETGKEHEVMGEARDNVMDRAQEKAQETQQSVKRVAEEAQGAARQEAENQGLTDQ